MKEFNNLHEHLRECVDSDNFTGVSDCGVEFNMFDWAYGLSTKARREHEQLNHEMKQIHKELNKLEAVKEYVNKKLDFLNSNGVQSFQLNEVKRLMNGE